MRRRQLVSLSLSLVFGLAASVAHGQGAKPQLDKSFDALVDSLLADWKVPGLGLAVVKGSDIVLLKGYGVKDLESSDPVTPNTKFAIGSVTKSFVVTALAAQVKAKKVKWDEPVRTYLPDFRLHDPVATDRMTVRDLVTHRSGLPRHDLLWYGSPLTRKELYERLRFLPPSRDFRSYWQYQNLMFMTAGYLSGKLNGTSWEDAVRSLVFEPVGMRTADFSVDAMQRSPDFSYPHAAGRDEPAKRMPFRNIDAVGPAGSINASVEEMSQYLRMHMAGGKWDDHDVVARRDAAQMQSPQMVMAAPITDPEIGHTQYGMGFFITTYRGHKMVTHGGNIDGFSAELNFLPQDSIGVVVLTNLNGTPVRDLLPRYVYDRLLGLSGIDWSGRFKERRERQLARQDSLRAAREAKRVAETTPSHRPTDYAGTYQHDGYGSIAITATGDGLHLKFNSFELPLEHFHYDVFETKAAEGAPIRWRVQFHMDPDGDITSLTVPIEQSLPPTRFTKKKAP